MAPSKSLELETFAIDGNVVLRLHPRFIDVIGVKFMMDYDDCRNYWWWKPVSY